jgi:hypothetical protein
MPNATPLPQHSHLAILLAPPSSEVRNQNNQLIYFNRAVKKMQVLFRFFFEKELVSLQIERGTPHGGAEKARKKGG